MQNHNQISIFIFFHLVSNNVEVGCKQLVGHNSILSFCTPSFNCCMQRKCIFAVLWQNPLKHVSTIYPNVFNSFYRTAKHVKTHGMIYKEILLSMRWSSHFPAFESTSFPTKIPPSRYTPFYHPPKQVQKTHEPSR